MDFQISSDIFNKNITKYYNYLEKDFELWKIIPKINKENKLIYFVQNKNNKKFWKIGKNGKLQLSKFKNISKLIKKNMNFNLLNYIKK